MLTVYFHRYLLGFGTVTQYIGYNAMCDFFPTMVMRPNPQCSSGHCLKRQAEHQAARAALPQKEEGGLGVESQTDEPLHEDNVWGM